MKLVSPPLNIARPLAVITDEVPLEELAKGFVLFHEDAVNLKVNGREAERYDLGFHCQEERYGHVPDRCYALALGDVKGLALEVSKSDIRMEKHGLDSIRGTALLGYLEGIRNRL